MRLEITRRMRNAKPDNQGYFKYQEEKIQEILNIHKEIALLQNNGDPVPKHLQNSFITSNIIDILPPYLKDEKTRLETIRCANPQPEGFETRFGFYNDYKLSIETVMARKTQGWYIPEGKFFPLGDNRDNSRDGRFFGPVHKSKVLGKGSIIYWPPGRLKIIR
jgi:signal peptidase I